MNDEERWVLNEEMHTLCNDIIGLWETGDVLWLDKSILSQDVVRRRSNQAEHDGKVNQAMK